MSLVRNIADGEIITEPGLYRMSLEWYHDDCCDGFSVSSSGLRTVFSESPWAFWSTHKTNPNAYPRKSSSAFNLGRAVHALVLGDEVWEDGYAIRPIEFKDWRSKAAQEWRAEQETAGKVVVTADDMITIGHMCENIAKNPEAQAGLTGELYELSMIWRDEITGLWLKSRVDNIPRDGYSFADLKTFAPKSKNIKLAVSRSITDYRYDMQMALGLEGAETLGLGHAEAAMLIFAQTTVPYNVVTVAITDTAKDRDGTTIANDALYWARVANRQAMNTIAECLDKGEWPMPVEGIMDYTMPPSLLERYQQMQDSGELPSIGI